VPKRVGCEKELERLLIIITIEVVVVVVVVNQGTQRPLTMRISGGRLLMRRCSRGRGPSDIIRGSKDILISKVGPVSSMENLGGIPPP